MADWLQNVLDNIINWATTAGIRIIIALILLIISFRIVTWITRRIEKRLINKKKLDKTLTSTLFYALRIVIKIVILACLIGYLGIDTAGLAALIASIGVGIGLAVNGALSNLAGGVLILITRPFKIDDYISAGGFEGTVEDIRIVYTKLRTVDNKVVYAPNGPLSSSTIVNFSEKDLRRVDLNFTIEKKEDYKKAEEVILNVANSHAKVLKDPAAMSRILEHTTNGTTIVVRSWVKNADYWDVFFDLQENIKKALDENGIVMPINQLDVRVKKD
ncbi:MAG: mechanosensitive ion channel family protein [Clostridiales bacterium]|nr:mechanosensitive ion channel family protein [Clostridiales bacterium]